MRVSLCSTTRDHSERVTMPRVNMRHVCWLLYECSQTCTSKRSHQISFYRSPVLCVTESPERSGTNGRDRRWEITRKIVLSTIMRARQFSYTKKTQSTLTQRMSVQQHFPSIPAEVQKNRVRSARLTTAISSRDLPCSLGFRHRTLLLGNVVYKGNLKILTNHPFRKRLETSGTPSSKTSATQYTRCTSGLLGAQLPTLVAMYIQSKWSIPRRDISITRWENVCLQPTISWTCFSRSNRRLSLNVFLCFLVDKQQHEKPTKDPPESPRLQAWLSKSLNKMVRHVRWSNRVLRHIQKRQKRALQIMQKI